MRNNRLDNVVAIIGRKNSGKTTLVTEIIRELRRQDLVVSSLKHHSHDDFDIDIPGKDSYQHHLAGTEATAIASATRFAMVEDWRTEGMYALQQQANTAISLLPASNVVIVEGFKQAGLPAIEVFRQDNPRDVEAVPEFRDRMLGLTLGASALPAAVVTDIPEIATSAEVMGIPHFKLYDISQISAWIVENFSKPLLSVSIQAGGESRRMGSSKALIPFHGRPLIEHMVSRFAPIAADLFVTTNEPEELFYLQGRYPGLRLITDTHKKRGALQGFATALEAARFPSVAVIACDVVNLSPDLIEHEAALLEEAQRSSAYIPYDAVVPMGADGFEPFCGVYERDRCMGPTQECINLKKVRMRHVLEMLNVCIIDPHDNPLCPEGCFENVNTPDDLKRAERY